MTKSWFTLASILIAGSLVTLSGIEQAVAVSGSDVDGLELYYRDSALQCGSNSTQANIKVKVYDKDNKLLTTMSKGDRYTNANIDSAKDLKFVYNVYNLSCLSNADRPALGSMLLGPNDTVPNISGFSGQASIQQMLVGLDSYEELYLVELGSNNTSSSAYDLQDVVIVVDNDPDSLKPISPLPNKFPD